MSCKVASHPFQAHADYGTWSITFQVIPQFKEKGSADIYRLESCFSMTVYHVNKGKEFKLCPRILCLYNIDD